VDEDLFKTVEEVFNSATVSAVLELCRRKVIYELKGVISAGKESRVYWGKSFNNEDIAVKIYLTSTAEFRKSMVKYIMGDPRFKKIPKSTRKLVIMWASKEFRNLRLMYDAGITVPRPIAQYENILVMEFLGIDGVRAPLLKEVELDVEELRYVFKHLVDDIRRMYLYAGLVHGDLSEYNVMLYNGKPYIIDVSQAVKISHPNAYDLLIRDVSNLIRYFNGLGVNTPSLESMLNYITGKGSLEDLME